MNLSKRILVVALTFLAFGCNQNKVSKDKTASNSHVVAFDSDDLDTLDYKTKLSFTGEVQLSKFGEPGETYKKGDELPNQAYILRLNSPKSFYYKDDMDS
ncbi:MAG: hypothetical protein EOP00_13080, partial [Pedobacter sp.]